MKQRSVSITVTLTAILIICDVQTSSCPSNVNQFIGGHSAVYNNTCYLFVNNELQWEDARDECWKLRGEMLTVEDSRTMEFIKKTLNSSNNTWDRTSAWLGAQKVSGSWKWINDRPITNYTNWHPTLQPTNERDLCLLVHKDSDWMWQENRCKAETFQHNYICQFHIQTSSCPSNVKPVIGGHSAVYNNTCYLFVNNELQWDDARDECFKLRGEMLTVEDSKTMEFIKKTLDSSNNTWDRTSAWLGAQKVSGSWKWINGRLMTSYTNWQPNTLKKIDETGMCLLIRQETDWQWQRNKCKAETFQHNYICQFPSITSEQLKSSSSTENAKTLVIGILVCLSLIMGTILLAQYLHSRCTKQTADTSVHPGNHLYCNASVVETADAEYHIPSQTFFPSTEHVYQSPI